ncbi:hypothetical protein HanIR_Chr17g0874771 [Helianthus annuus]|nr:hypothetical protein HanIR_Chr17g0874771 [Helianthus annuus]
MPHRLQPTATRRRSPTSRPPQPYFSVAHPIRTLTPVPIRNNIRLELRITTRFSSWKYE